MEEQIVSVENASFSYGTNTVLDNVSLKINKGDFVGIIGHNGSAKSTLLKLMVGLLKPDKGTIKLFGTSVEKFKDYKKIGYISQNVRDFNQMFPATVEEVVSINLYHKRNLFTRFRNKDNEKIEKILEIVEMDKFKTSKIGNLSGGQKQRVFIARSLVNNPKILFMDEPLVGIDLESQNKFYDLLSKLNNEYNITLVMISHDVGVISKKVDKIFCLTDGKVYVHDKNNDVYINRLKDIYGEDVNMLFHKH
ncbi:metal ABC transporter ATP-binding protein [Schnuerera sp. xch1]|uniref:metal ABC transporter ATP-binding protein n=1 Tax=Schnuerera sp. xch1 TaxID=2874283 RepID=UPI001CBAFF9C|nr:metal ABC transporter ATP-binding protein [Schnuerera sp. xch1]MBZ2175310.1 metal ABC transporter ATP-binding protein [Schnuerera sp. xch1]